MIKKERLLKQLNKLLDMEKNLVPLLNRHVASSLEFSGLGDTEREEFNARLQEMARIHVRHVEELTIIKTRIAEGDIDVY